MTSPEHALVGIHAALALSIHRKLGWQAVALAALASILPDWDGLLILIDISLFDQGHRVWGHNVISIVTTSVMLAFCEARLGWVSKAGHRLSKYGRVSEVGSPRAHFATAEAQAGWVSLTLVALLAQLVHLPCDMVVSGGKGLSDWAIQPWWPFSDRGYVYPLIPWGDVGPTVILMAGILLSAKLLRQIPAISGWTLLCLAAYLVVRGWMRDLL